MNEAQNNFIIYFTTFLLMFEIEEKKPKIFYEKQQTEQISNRMATQVL